jgi:RNA polymerase sigma-70 factor, ECF subfamily
VGHHGRVGQRDFERLYEENAQGLLGFLVYRTGDRPLAEDLLADTFERILRTRVKFDRRKASEKTWIYSIALNLLRDHARRRGAEERALERAQVPVPFGAESRDYEAADDREAIHRALHVLSDEEREAISLRYGADLTVPEIAKLTKEPLTRVEGRVYRALRKLKSEMG